MAKHVVAVYPGTFDPITLGHEDMIRRAAQMFGQVVVAVAAGHHKKTMFSLDERLALARGVFSDVPNIRVESFDGLVRDFVRAQGARVMVRGLRSGTDFDYEFQLALMNRRLERNVETVFLMTGFRWIYISSTGIRNTARLGGSISGLVPAHVERALAEKFGR